MVPESLYADCYELNTCVSPCPHPYTETLTPTVGMLMVLGGGASGREAGPGWEAAVYEWTILTCLLANSIGIKKRPPRFSD